MSQSDAKPADVFDVRKVRRLVELMNEHELSEIDLRQGEQRIRLRKGGEPVTMASEAPRPVANTQATSPQPAATEADVSASKPTEDDNAIYITSPMVGTFYTASNPEAAAFISVGDRVGPETTVCIIEAMKVFNELQAECSGTIAAVLVENAEPVEYGQKLFKVIP